MKLGTLTMRSKRNKGGLRAVLAAALLWLSFLAMSPAWADLGTGDVQIYRSAFKAADRGDFREAHQIARRAKEDLPSKILLWMDLTRPDSTADWETLTRFLTENPDWPNQAGLRRNAEGRMPSMSPAKVKEWFAKHPPVTTAGFVRHVDALLALGESATAIAMVRERYVQGTFGSVEERDFRKRYHHLLRPEDHWARLDRLLWDQDDVSAKRVMPLVDKGRQHVALARIALFRMDGGVESALRKVPSHLAKDPGLLFERMRWRRRKGLDDGALDILDKAPKDLGRADAWWQERHILARRLMEKGQFARAYKLVVRHGQEAGLGFAQAEFLSGWLALRFLDKPSEALKRFEALHRGVSSPISLSRGAYWAGRAAAALGDKAKAKSWYESAAQHGTTFYGMLAAEELGRPPGSTLPKATKLTDEVRKKFNKRELVRATRMLEEIEGRHGKRVELFLRRLTIEAKTPEEYQLVASLTDEFKRRDLGVTVARQALQDGAVVYEAGFPMLDAKLTPRPEPAFVHAIVRQESSFIPDAVSSASARGLMQLMPATAQHVAKQLGLKHSHDKLISDPAYNVRLGSYFLQDLVDRYGGSYVLATAAYNGGPGRVAAWLRQFGDPRSGSVDIVDWIELVPIYETRNYVHRVMENLQIYRARLGLPARSLTSDLRRAIGGAG